MRLEETVIKKLKTAHMVLSSIESCTGGLIGHLITNVSGASEVFWGGTIVYNNSAKLDLGVSKETLRTYGAVSSEVAKELAEQGLKKMRTCVFHTESPGLVSPKGFVCISTTGIAEPEKGTGENSVILCFTGIAVTGKETFVRKFLPDSSMSRLEAKNQFANFSLDMLLGII